MAIRFEIQPREILDKSRFGAELSGAYTRRRRNRDAYEIWVLAVDEFATYDEWSLLRHWQKIRHTARSSRVRFAAVVGPASLGWPLMVADGPRRGEDNLPLLIGYRWWLLRTRAVRLAWQSVAMVNGLSGVLWSSHDLAYMPDVSQRRCWPCR